MTLTLGMGGAFLAEGEFGAVLKYFYTYKETGGLLDNWILFLADLPSLQILNCLNSSLFLLSPPPFFFSPKALDVFSSKAFALCVSSHFPDLPSSLFFGLSVLLINHCGSPERSSQRCCVRLSSRPSLSQNSVLEVRAEGGVWEGEGRRTLGLSSTHLAAPNWLLVQEA